MGFGFGFGFGLGFGLEFILGSVEWPKSGVAIGIGAGVIWPDGTLTPNPNPGGGRSAGWTST